MNETTNKPAAEQTPSDEPVEVPQVWRDALKELLTSDLSEMPSPEAGKEAQDAWADMKARARKNAQALLDGLPVTPLQKRELTPEDLADCTPRTVEVFNTGESGKSWVAMTYAECKEFAENVLALALHGTPPPAIPAPHECKTEAERIAYSFGWWKALEHARSLPPSAWVAQGARLAPDASLVEWRHAVRRVFIIARQHDNTVPSHWLDAMRDSLLSAAPMHPHSAAAGSK